MVVAATAATAWSSTASANNSRVSIADFQWSNKTPHIDLGESVIWTWTGPDTNHSVTGRAPTENPFDPITTDDASQWDSDPGNEPNHEPGEEFKITFDHPGSYLFACKLHSVVRGVVTVSNDPGDPLSDPGPRPSINWDVDAPTVDDYFFTRDGTFPASPVIGPKGKGVGFRFSLGETGTASADYYQLVKRGASKRTLRVFRGYDEWNSHVGINRVRFAGNSRTFKPKPGNYIAFFRVEDEAANSSRDITLRFKIKRR